MKRRVCWSGGLAVVLITMLYLSAWAVPGLVSYQGRLEDLSTGEPVTNAGLPMTFRIYDAQVGGTLLWEEDHASVPVQDGIYNVFLGNGTTTVGTFDLSLFSADDRWFEVEVDTELFTPRQRVASVAFAMKAASAEDADTLDGYDSLDFAESIHAHDGADITTGSVADARIPGTITRDSELTAGLAGKADNVHTHAGDDITSGTVAETRIADSLARDSEITWDNLSGKPDGFADGEDDDSGGDITSVSAGTGLNGGGSTGDVSLNVKVPLDLTGSTTGNTPIIKGTNSGSGYGLYGWSAYNYGVFGYSGSAPGVTGYSGSGAGVEGLNGSWGNQGQLGTSNVGVYGKGMTSSSSGVYGVHNNSGNVGKLGTSNDGVYGVSNAAGGSGIAGINNSSGNGVYGRSVSGYAGNFQGKVRASADDGPQFIVHDRNGGGTRPGIQFTNNSEQYISGDDKSDEYFKFYSAFSKSREFSAHLRVYGKAADAWDRSIGLTHDGNDGILETDYGDLILDPADNDVWIKEAIPTLTLNSTESSPAIAYTRLNFSQNDVIKWQMAWDSKNQRLYWSTPGIGDCLIIHDGSGDVETGASLYVNGNIHVSGDILSSSRTGRHTVSPPEFRPMDSSWPHSVTGDTLRPNFALSVPAPVYPFYAPVMLPDGVTVTKIIVNWTDNDADHGMCMTLDRATHNEGTGSRMATTCCNGGLGERKLNYTTDIDDAVIDNVYYKYYLTFHVDGRTNGNLKLHGVRIQYEYSSL